MSESTSPTPDKTVSLDTTQVISGPVSDRTQMGTGVTCPVCMTANGTVEIYCIDCGFKLSGSPVAVEDIHAIQPAKLISSDGTREFPLKQGINTVGRKDSDVLVADGSVSRNHAVITVNGNVVQLTDIGSTNGTQVNKKLVDQNQQITLSDGCEIQFGSIILKYASAPESDQSLISEPISANQDGTEGISKTPNEDLALKNTTLTPEINMCDEATTIYGVLHTKDGTLGYEISKPLCNIGRRANNDIVIADSFCSGSHAILECANGNVSITDIGSSNGTQVNGILLEANQPRVLAFGDELTIGQTSLIFEEA